MAEDKKLPFFKKKEKVVEEDTRAPGVRRLETFMKYFSYVFVSFCWALTVEVSCFAQSSIRMSDFGYIFWYVFIIGFLGACYCGRGHRRGVGWRGTLGSVLCTVMFFIIFYAGDFYHMWTAVGQFTKQGFFGLRFYWDYKTVGAILTGFFFVGAAIIFIYEAIHKAPPQKFEDK